MEEIPIDAIEPNPFNSRSEYPASSISRMASSLQAKGQIATVKVRPHPSSKGRYQIVFGHRRLQAAKNLGWRTIRAEVVNMTDEDMLEQSLIENIERETISDYDKAAVFRRFNKDFHRTYEDIAQMIGTTRQNVSNYVGMLDLFTDDEVVHHPELVQVLQDLSEHHARLLSGVEDRNSRIELAKMTVAGKTSVRELDHVIGRLRGWYPMEVNTQSLQISQSKRNDEEAIRKVTGIVMDYLRFAHEGRWRDFVEFHLFEKGFTMFDDLPPYNLLDRNLAYSKKREWVKDVAPRLMVSVKALKVDVFKNAAIVTLELLYSGKLKKVHVESRIRGTLVLVERRKAWKIFHEHWSRMDSGKSRGSVGEDLISSASPAPSNMRSSNFIKRAR